MENECKTRSDINCTDFGEESCLFSKLSVNLKCFWDEMNAECISEALNTE